MSLPITCGLCGHDAEAHLFASPRPICERCPNQICQAVQVPRPAPTPAPPTREELIYHTLIAFHWWNYGLDNVGTALSDDWARELAAQIVQRLAQPSG